MITLPPLGRDEDELWNALLDIADRLADGWTLIGGQMVFLHGLERAQVPPRVSEDLDLVVDARARPAALPRLMSVLNDLHFRSVGVSPEGTAHRFGRGGVRIDVVAPDGLGPRTDLRTIGGAVTIAVAGGTYALSETSLVNVEQSGRAGRLPRPSLAGALVVKAGAARTDRGPKGPDRHLRDLAFLCTLIDDVIELLDHLGPKNCRRLGDVRKLADEGHEAWALLGDGRGDAYDAWRVLAGLP